MTSKNGRQQASTEGGDGGGQGHMRRIDPAPYHLPHTDSEQACNLFSLRPVNPTRYINTINIVKTRGGRRAHSSARLAVPGEIAHK